VKPDQRPMVELVRAGLAMATVEHMVAGGKSIEVARVRIREAGRRALVQRPKVGGTSNAQRN